MPGMDPEPMPDERAPRWIEYMRLDTLRASGAHRNPKAHDEEALRASITRWGFADSPILDERTERLVAGHGRVEDLGWRFDMGSTPPDGIRVAEDGMWLVPVQRGWASESDVDAEGFLVGHNHVGERGGWDDRELAETLTDIADEDLSALFASSFTEADIDRLIAQFDDTEQRVAPPDRLIERTDDEDDGSGTSRGDDPEHPQWHTVVIRQVNGTTRAAWLAHLDTFNGDEVAAFENLLGTADDVSEEVAAEAAMTRAGLLRVGKGVYIGRDPVSEPDDDEPHTTGSTPA